MKVALVFSGQPRFVEQNGYLSTKSTFLDKYDCDVYAHFWFSKGTLYETAPWSGLGALSIPDNAIDRFVQLYSPKGIHVEPPPREDEIVKRIYERSSNIRTPYNTFSVFTSHKRAFDLIPYPEDYDFIIRHRTDNIILRIPDLTTLSKDCIYRITQAEDRKVYNDSFAIFPGKYAKYFFHSVNILDDVYDKGCYFNNEELFSGILEYHNLIPICKTFTLAEFNFAFQRENNRIQICRQD